MSIPCIVRTSQVKVWHYHGPKLIQKRSYTCTEKCSFVPWTKKSNNHLPSIFMVLGNTSYLDHWQYTLCIQEDGIILKCKYYAISWQGTWASMDSNFWGRNADLIKMNHVMTSYTWIIACWTFVRHIPVSHPVTIVEFGALWVLWYP